MWACVQYVYFQVNWNTFQRVSISLLYIAKYRQTQLEVYLEDIWMTMFYKFWIWTMFWKETSIIYILLYFKYISCVSKIIWCSIEQILILKIYCLQLNCKPICILGVICCLLSLKLYSKSAFHTKWLACVQLRGSQRRARFKEYQMHCAVTDNSGHFGSQ